MAEIINVFCKLPHGLVLRLHPKDPGFPVKGLNSTVLPNVFTYQADHAVTEVPKEIWEPWLAKNQGLSFVKNGMLWGAAKMADGAAKAKEMSELKTGFEPLIQQSQESASTPGTATAG